MRFATERTNTLPTPDLDPRIAGRVVEFDAGRGFWVIETREGGRHYLSEGARLASAYSGVKIGDRVLFQSKHDWRSKTPMAVLVERAS